MSGEHKVIGVGPMMFPSGTKVEYFGDGGMVVVPGPDSPLAGRRFYRWPNGDYVEDSPPGQPPIVIKKDGEIINQTG